MRILVVDDQELNRTMLEFMLKSEGYEVFLTENGRVAVDKFEEIQPDIVLLDVIMPEMDGYETAPLLKGKAGERHLPIIFLTALDDQKSMIKCLEVGGDDFLAKPFDKVTLTAKIKAHYRSRELSTRISVQKEKLQYHQNLIDREHCIVEHIFSNALKNNHFVDDLVKYHLSPASMFNGDVFLANRSPMGGSYVLLGDFTGHGLAAAVGALPTAQTFFTMTAKGLSVGDIAKEINSQLFHLLPDDMFCAACVFELTVNGTAASIWSGGMPETLLINIKGGIRQRIPSQHMALGILDEDEFEIDSYNFDVGEDDKIIACTDGVIEATNAKGEMFGQERLEALYQSNPDSSLDDVIAALTKYCGTDKHDDDVSLIQLNCKPINDLKAAKVEDIQPLPWNFKLDLGPKEIRETDPVSQVLDMVSAIKGISMHRSALFLVLAELYNNSVDHGLLELDSTIKNGEDGFFEYYIKRQEALESLNTGAVSIKVNYLPDRKRIVFTVKDSGNGFDSSKSNDADDLHYAHGRGINLIDELCDNITYSLGGARVVVEYSIEKHTPLT